MSWDNNERRRVRRLAIAAVHKQLQTEGRALTPAALLAHLEPPPVDEDQARRWLKDYAERIVRRNRRALRAQAHGR